jgi:hypothetical protein
MKKILSVWFPLACLAALMLVVALLCAPARAAVRDAPQEKGTALHMIRARVEVKSPDQKGTGQ